MKSKHEPTAKMKRLIIIGSDQQRRWRTLMRRCPSLPVLSAGALTACTLLYVMTLASVFEAGHVNVPVELVGRLNYSWQVSPCQPDTYALLLVGSHPAHGQLRQVLRRFWGRPNITGRPFKILFLFGLLSDTALQKSLEAEQQNNGDILQGDFADSYHNVTLRDLMGLNWASQHCSRVSFVVRADDDIAFDPYHLVERLDRLQFSGYGELIACFQVMSGAKPLRYGRYGVAHRDFPGNQYADYCQGWMYVLTPRTAGKLVAVARQVPPLWINDVYITGQLVQQLGMKRQLLGVEYSDYYKDMKEQADRSLNSDGSDIYRVGPTRAESDLAEALQLQFLAAASIKPHPSVTRDGS